MMCLYGVNGSDNASAMEMPPRKPAQVRIFILL